ncbi:MAG TPA: tetratricopeptide repeat protein [Anaerolineae bacterium]|nr:tetratricopeptide repeat protein [Anaerolineae bacterium]HNU03204.1 tetratricopeptide repeat protein [Anaerolineae bacterium]
MAAFSPPAIAHQIEYFRLAIVQDDHDGVYRWADRFVHAWMDNAVDECRLLLAGIKGSGIWLSLHSQAIALRCQALLELLLEDYERSQADFLRSLALFDQTGDDFNASRVLNDLGTLSQARGELHQAVERYRQALARLLPDWAGQTEEAMMRNNLGLALVSLGDDQAGAAELERAQALYSQLGQPQGVARAQINLGQVYRRRGDLALASAAYEQALQVLRIFGDLRPVVDVLNSLGLLARQQGRLDQAIDYYTQSLATAQQVQDLGGQAQALGNIGAVHQVQGRLERARSCYQDALALYEMLADQRGQALMLGNLGRVESLEEHLDAALDHQQRSLDLYSRSGDLAGEARALISLGAALRELGQIERAETTTQDALAISRQQQDLHVQEAALSALGTLRMRQERWAEAEALLHDALAVQRQRQDPLAEVETHYKFAMIAHAQGQSEEELVEILRPAWELAQEHGYGRWLVNMAWLLGDAAFEQGATGAYNYYATASVIARQYEDEARYRKSVDTLAQHVTRSVELGEPERASFLARYVIDYWRDNGWADLVDDGIEQLTRLGR